MIEVGQPAVLAMPPILNAYGAAVNPATAAVTITQPDGTETKPAVTMPPATRGVPQVTWTPAQAGLHRQAWVTTGPAAVWTDYFNVREYISVVSLAEAKAHLNITSTADDDELRSFLAAATELVEDRAGPCARRSVTERVSGSGQALALCQHPVISVESVTSVWLNGPTWTTPQLLVDQQAGIVSLIAPHVIFWNGPWDVSYTAGRAVIPERIQHACKELLRHLWETQRGAVQAPPTSGEEFVTSYGWAFSVPRRVLELLESEITPAL